jgi:hypothetical protein
MITRVIFFIYNSINYNLLDEANPYHCEETESSARQLTLYISTIAPNEIYFNKQYLIHCTNSDNVSILF